MELVQITKVTVVCPFRSEIHATTEINEDGIPIQIQTTVYPECQYASCPFYNSKGQDASEKCDRTLN